MWKSWTLVFFIWLSGCGKTPEENLYHQKIFVFGTLVDVSVITDNEALAQTYFSELEQDFDYLHHAWHPWEQGSLMRVNQLCSYGDAFTVGPAVLPLIEESQELYRLSEGLFNPAIGKLVKLWQFHLLDKTEHSFVLPAEDEINSLVKSSPGMDDIELNGLQMRCSNTNVWLDFGAYAKGVAVQRAVDKMHAMGIEHGLVNAGGDIKVSGTKFGEAWRIGIKNPFPDDPREAIGSLNMTGDESVFTSGGYERFFTWQGKKYHHIIDPRTGYPAQNTLSVTVLHTDAALADAAATALFVAGPEEFPRIAQKMGLTQVMLVASDHTIYITPEMSSRLSVPEDFKTITVQLVESRNNSAAH